MEERAGEGRDAFGLPQDVQILSPKEKQTNSKLPESGAVSGQGIPEC